MCWQTQLLNGILSGSSCRVFFLRYPLVTSHQSHNHNADDSAMKMPMPIPMWFVDLSILLPVCLSVHPLRLSVCLCIYILLSFWYYLCPPLCVRAFRFVPLQFSHSYYNRFYRFFIIGSRIFQPHLLKKALYACSFFRYDYLAPFLFLLFGWKYWLSFYDFGTRYAYFSCCLYLDFFSIIKKGLYRNTLRRWVEFGSRPNYNE